MQVCKHKSPSAPMPRTLQNPLYVLLQLLPVQLAAAVPQSGRRLLRSNVPLRLGQHLISHQELPHRGTPQQGRVEVDVEVRRFDFFRSAGE